MEKFEKLTAAAAPMPASNIDTDIIMPKAFLKRIDKEALKVFSMMFAFTRTEENEKILYSISPLIGTQRFL